MKKTLIVIFFLFIFIHLVPKTSALTSDELRKLQRLPGISCGVAGGDSDSDVCCNVEPKKLPGIPGGSLLRWAPVIGKFVRSYEAKQKEFEDLQKRALQSCMYGDPVVNKSDGVCRCQKPISDTIIPKFSEMCDTYLKGSTEYGSCKDCAEHRGGLWTGMGCVPANLSAFVSSFVLSVGISIAFLTALLCIIYSVFVLQTSRGDTEKIKKAREYITNCVLGLILIIFSVFIMKVIGVNILNIPFIQ